MSAVIYLFPTTYRVAYSTGSRQGLIGKFSSKTLWEVEEIIFALSERHPTYTFWHTTESPEKFAINCT